MDEVEVDVDVDVVVEVEVDVLVEVDVHVMVAVVVAVVVVDVLVGVPSSRLIKVTDFVFDETVIIVVFFFLHLANCRFPSSHQSQS